jgi:dihydrofolate synthase / folylpolyglutamate synthase
MNYQETLSYLLEQLPMYQRIGVSAYRTGLDNTYKLDDYFNNPHRHFKTIHVAGTNGKGSVTHLLSSVLQEAGYKTGLYTSPHLVDFRERIKVNGRLITKRFVMEFVNKHKFFFDTFNPSFFEISVFMAFTWFQHCHVDVAVIEVGLGGRLDATNIISPVLSVITNIGKDHTEILGDTLERIAAEKAGIIKRRIPVVIGESQPQILHIFNHIAEQHNAPLQIADQEYQIDSNIYSKEKYQVFNVCKGNETFLPNLKCGLLGHYQQKNVITVLATVDQLKKAGFNIDEKSIYSGIRKVIGNTGLSGRWQVIQCDPCIICDTAHNTDGLRLVLQQVAHTAYQNLHLIIGFVSDKDVNEILKFMPETANYYFTRLSVPRTMDENSLANLASRYRLKGQAYKDIKEAFKAAQENAGLHDLIFITGSTFLVGDFLKMYKHADIPVIM